MKLKQLITISDKNWVDGFQKSLDKKKATKGSSIVTGLRKNVSEETLIAEVYGSCNDKTKRAFQQQLTDLYKQFLFFLCINHRDYPHQLLGEVSLLIQQGKETEFYALSEVLERTFSDTENYEALVQLHHLLRDHYGAKLTKKPLYWEQIKKLKQANDTLQKLYSLEEYFNDHDLIRRKKTIRKNEVAPADHYLFFEKHFNDETSDRIKLKARLFWLRFTKTNNFHGLTDEPAKKVISEIVKLLSKKPFLHFANPEALHHYVLTYRVYTAVDTLSPKQFRAIFNEYYATFDGNRLLEVYPRIYQSLITTQSRYYTVRAGFQFMDDPKPLEKETEKGLEEVIGKMQLVRTKGSFEDENHRLFGMMGEATAHACLFGDHRKKAVELLEMLFVSEQQTQSSLGAHAVYINLCHCFFWTKQWDRMLETYEKYLRLVKVNGWFDEPSRRTLEFMKLISNHMLGMGKTEPSKIEAECARIFEEDKKGFETFVPYTLSFLRLSA
jgi:hypothetical protein